MTENHIQNPKADLMVNLISIKIGGKPQCWPWNINNYTPPPTHTQTKKPHTLALIKHTSLLKKRPETFVMCVSW